METLLNVTKFNRGLAAIWRDPIFHGGTVIVRSLSKVFAIAVGLLAIVLSCSPIRANGNDVRAGKFTLPNPARMNGVVLPAGDYTFRLKRTQSNADMLVIRRDNQQMLSFLVYPDSACETCRDTSLKLAVLGDFREVTSMDLAGYHVDLNPHKSASAGQESVKIQEQSEQVAVQVDPN
jgi:hypothetical protein